MMPDQVSGRSGVVPEHFSRIDSFPRIRLETDWEGHLNQSLNFAEHTRNTVLKPKPSRVFSHPEVHERGKPSLLKVQGGL
jgi:hypothetical protein